MSLVMGYYDRPRDDKERVWSEGWHNGMNNYLWADGHVKAMKPETRSEFPSGLPTYQKNIWYAKKYR